MKTKLLPLALGLCLSITALRAQVSLYTFTQTSGSYGNPSSGTLIGGQLQDDDVNTVALPFTFTFNGTAYNTIDVCANGYVSFNSLTGFEFPPISDNTTADLISPFGTDLAMATIVSGDITAASNTITNCSSVVGYSVGDVLIDYNFDFGGTNPTITAIGSNYLVLNISSTNTQSAYDVIGLNGYIKQSVTGTSPNQVFELEFKNFTTWNSFYDEVISFKIRLYQTSNVVEIVYGNCISGVGFSVPEVGLKGNVSTDYNSRLVTSPNTWATSVASSNITDGCDFYIGQIPSSGQSYKWTPVACVIPSLTATQSSSFTCEGQVIQTVTITAAGATTYSWVNGPSTAQMTVNPGATTTYTVIGANNTCTSSIMVTHSVVPSPTVTITQPSLTICAGETTTLTAGGATTYSWVNGPSTAKYVVNPTTTTSYTVIGDNGNCTNTKTVVQTVSPCTGISENNSLSNHLELYPNPFRSELTINNTSGADLNIVIMDALGRKIYASEIKAESSRQIETDHLNKGVYFVQMKSGNDTVTKKLIKE